MFHWTIDPRVFHERLTIQLAVAAREGEPYMLSMVVFQPGEVLGGLHWALGKPVRAQDLVPYLARLGITPVWTVVYPTDDPSVTQSERVSDVPDGEILTGNALDDSTVEFQVVPDGVTLAHDRPAQFFEDRPVYGRARRPGARSKNGRGGCDPLGVRTRNSVRRPRRSGVASTIRVGGTGTAQLGSTSRRLPPKEVHQIRAAVMYGSHPTRRKRWPGTDPRSPPADGRR